MLAAVALLATAVGIGAQLVPSADAAFAPTGGGFTVTPGDLAFILKQIKIAEEHAKTLTPSNPCGTLVATPGDGIPDDLQIPDRLTAYGLRTVDGTCNNLFPGREKYAGADLPFPRLSGTVFRNAEAAPAGFPVQASSSYTQKKGTVYDSQPRVVSNLIDDQTSTNPAAVAAALHPVRTQGDPASATPCTTDPAPGAPATSGTPAGCTPSHQTLFIPNVTTDVGLSPPFNSLFTFFGQFFDHGVDQTVKSGGTVVIPLHDDDPLVTLGPDGQPNTGDEVPPNQRFMVLTRAQNQPGPDGVLGDDPNTPQDESADDIQDANNTDSPEADQSQTYTSHSSHQVFLREYALNASNHPVSTGKLLGGLPAGQTYAGSPDGTTGMATWAAVKKQAAEKLGLLLQDKDVTNIPMLLADPYGNFIPGPARGLPQYVTKTGLVEGNLATPVAVPSNVVYFDTPFLTDIAHNADPSPQDTDNNPATPPVVPTPDADNTPSSNFKAQPPGTYDDELLNAHFCAGDGRVNENIALSTIHTVFHSEHDRLVDYIKGVLTADTSPSGVAALPDWKLPTSVSPDGWNGSRLFQAARFVTEMEYQHIVFEEFARKVQPLVRPFHVYSPDINPVIPAEFAHAVYRFGHSMLDDTVARKNIDGSDNSVPLLTAFLNPPEFFNGGTAGTLTPEQAAGSIVMGSSDQVGNEIDEFVTETLRNNLLGLPLDLPTLNMARARDAGVPPLNQVRRAIFAKTNDGQLAPYTSWSDFGQHLKHPESLINFVAAYGTHPTITSQSTLAGKRAAAQLIVDPQPGQTPPADAADFMFSAGSWATPANGTPTTGLEDVDLWVGGLAEVTNLNGGLLGTTNNYVFQSTLENLQDGDRLYYLNRTPGMNLRTQLEGNSFAELIQRNTDGTNTLKADAFATADCRFQLGNLNGTAAGFSQFGSTVADDPTTTDCDESKLLLRKPDGTIQYKAINTVDPPGINGQSVYNGTSGVDRVAGGNDNDTFWGGPGNDIIEGQGGDDVALGGDGNDIITDLDGADVLKGGPGNDAIDTGPGNDISMGGDGQDFMNGGQNDNETFAGPGNDFIIAGAGADAVFGDGGDDWIEGGTGQDLLQGDHGAPFFDDPAEAAPGNDVFVGQPGENDYDAEGGDDLMAQNAAIDRNAGAAGFDWAIHQYDTVGADDDMAINNNLAGLPVPVVVNRDRWQETEGDSGSAFDDHIKGDDFIPFQQGSTFGVGIAGGFTGCDALDQAGLDRIPGLAALVPLNSGTDAQAQSAAGVGHITGLTCPLQGAFWGAGNILLGGAGSDTIEGRGGDDIIDGDSVLSTRIDVHQGVDANGLPTGPVIGSTDLMEHPYLPNSNVTLQQAVFAGTVDPGSLQIARQVTTPASPGSADTAVFSGNFSDYTITPATLSRTKMTITDNRGTDGTDTLYNIEKLQFADQLISIVPSGTLSPTSLTFGSTLIGNTTAPQTVTITNVGQTALVLTNVALVDPTGANPSADFIRPAAGGTCTNTTNLAQNASCTVNVQFRPAAGAAGTRSGILRFTDNNNDTPGSFQDVSLTGTALAQQPIAGVSPASVAFGSQPVGTPTATQTVTLSNTGNATLNIANIATSGDFSRIGGTCATTFPGTLAAGSSCTATVRYNATAAGAASGFLVFTDNSGNVAGSTQSVQLTGTGTVTTRNAAVSTTTVNFGTQTVGRTSPGQTVTLSNAGGNGALTISSIAIVGTNAGDFTRPSGAAGGTCGTTLNAGASCTVIVTARPTATGARTATLRFTDNATAGTTQNVTLNATAVAAVINVTPTSINFGNNGLITGGAGVTRTVTITNTGTAGSLLVVTPSLTGTNANQFSFTNNCPAAGQPVGGAGCTITVKFRATSVGTKTATLNVASNAGTRTVSLVGNGTLI